MASLVWIGAEARAYYFLLGLQDQKGRIYVDIDS